jgi:hypothetical protein
VVEVARLHGMRGARTYSIGHAYTLRPEFGREFARQILDRRTYPVAQPSPCEKGPCGQGTIKLCGEFEPGVVVRFHGLRGGMVDALLCFKCDDLGAVPRPSNGHGAGRTAPADIGRARISRCPELRLALERAKRNAADRARR